jgi:hypothetical protein
MDDLSDNSLNLIIQTAELLQHRSDRYLQISDDVLERLTPPNW